jgi:3-carboxy-cis,cis-muconate cycloisomerase
MTFDAIFVPAGLREAVADRAWLEAMLKAERALAGAESIAGIVPPHLATQIADACRIALFDVDAIVAEGRSAGNPVEPLVRALRAAVGPEAAPFVHLGATSQDIIDTAAMLVARRALDLILFELDGVARACAGLALAHRDDPLAARTLLQQAVPTTFGLKAAGWLVSVLAARRRLAAVRASGLAVQLGGAAGTLAALGPAALETLRLYAVELELPEPELPWHTDRTRIAELGFALAVAAGVCAKIGLDVALLEQTEVREVREGAGRSSSMPQKRNPVGSVLAVACARQAQAAAGVLGGSLVQEHERALGSWHAEWTSLSAALAAAGGAAASVHETLGHLELDVERMAQNLELGGGAAMSERVVLALTPVIGRTEAFALVGSATDWDANLRDTLLAAEPGGLGSAQIDDLLDPIGYLGAAGSFVDRALQLYEEER